MVDYNNIMVDSYNQTPSFTASHAVFMMLNTTLFLFIYYLKMDYTGLYEKCSFKHRNLAMSMHV